YLEQAAAAGSIKWRATRLRLGRLLESAVKSIEEELNEQQRKVLEEIRSADRRPRKPRRKQARAETEHDAKPEEQTERASSKTDARINQDQISATDSRTTPAPKDSEEKRQGPYTHASAETKQEESSSHPTPEPGEDSAKRKSEPGSSAELERKPA